MSKIILEIEFEYDDNLMHGNDEDATDWFLNDILKDDLLLFSKEIGDHIGSVKVLRHLTTRALDLRLCGHK